MSTDNSLLNYKITGQGFPLLLLHGLFGSKENLGALARPLSECYQVISIDLRNHGHSFHTESMGYLSMAEDIVRLLDSLEITRCSVIGHSMGGKTAMQLGLSFPERVTSIVVLDIAPVAYKPRHQGIMAGLKTANETSLESRKQADEILARFEPHPPTRQFLLTNLQRDENNQLYFRLNIDTIVSHQDSIFAAVTGEPFTGPALFVRGGNSDFVEEWMLESINCLFPNYQLISIPDAGHMIHADKPQQVNTVIKNFLHINCPS